MLALWRDRTDTGTTRNLEKSIENPKRGERGRFINIYPTLLKH